MSKIVEEDYYDLIIDNVLVPGYDTGDNITYLNLRNSLLHIRAEKVGLCDLGLYPYNRFPSLYITNSNISLEASGVGNVQRNPYLSLFGQGILVGIVDTGIEYQHPAFRYIDGSSRIVSIWDQTIESKNIPQGFTYGTEYTREVINVALKSENPLELVPTIDDVGHGTAIASVAAGSINIPNNFAGVVPDSELVVVKLKKAKNNLKQIFCVPNDKLCYQESDIILGVRYLVSVAEKLNRPIAICIALGSSQGGHDGSGALSAYITYLSTISRIGISVATGMEANNRRHYYAEVTGEPFTNEFELEVSDKDQMFSMEIWTYTPARVAVDLVTPTGETSKYIYPELSGCRQTSFIFSQSDVWINNIIFEGDTGEQLILIRFNSAIPGIWKIRLKNLQDEPFSFHAWLPASDLISKDTFFTASNPDTTITSPGNGQRTLTVAGYNQIDNSILIDSGRGYNRLGLIVPDVAAPGYDIPCAVRNMQYGRLTGTGAAAAHATGIMAMIFEWAVPRGLYTSISGNDISRLIIRGANRSLKIAYPNKIWGYGKIDVNSVFENLTIF